MCLDTTSFLKTKTTHTIQNMFSALKTLKFSTLLTIWELPSAFLLDFFLSSLNSYIFFFMESRTLWMSSVCLLYEKIFIEARFQMGFSQDFHRNWKLSSGHLEGTFQSFQNNLRKSCKLSPSLQEYKINNSMGFFPTRSHRLDVCV